MAGVMIGVDPHKASHTAVAISGAEVQLGQLRVRACTVQAERAVVRPGHPGSSGISGDGAGSLVHGTGVPILFPSQQTRESRSQLSQA
jgi:hypothetical protein